jgi:alkaline phosphatase D
VKKPIFFIPIILLFNIVSAQKEGKARLIAGPVIGAVTKTTAKIWIAYRGKGTNMLILADTAEKRVHYPSSYSYITDKKGEIALTLDFDGLKPHHRYNVLISIQGWGANAKYSFETPSDSAVKDFSFLLGSCALMNTDISRTVFPGGSNWIFYRMKKKAGEFMVWLGNDIYYAYPRQYSSYEAMFRRQLAIRKDYRKFYRDFLASEPNYAIWDDHDYGPNDSNRNFALKDSSMKIFKGFWPNNYPDQDNFKGNYFNFRYYDAEFFMTDDRYYRAPKGDTAGDFLGETQLLWLKNKLLMSDAAFKFICIGSQVLNDNNFGESYADYPKERNELFDFIAANNIKGVVFLTGDKHYAEICKRDWNGYPLYDFTSSPLTSPVLPRGLLGAYHNQWRIPGTDYPLKNFGKIFLSGEKGNRTARMVIYGRGGREKREFTINQNELERRPGLSHN